MEQSNLLPAGDNEAGAVRLIRPALTVTDLRRLFLERAAVTGPDGEGQRGDHDLNPGMEAATQAGAAAVLVPLVDRPAGMTVLLTLRTAHLSTHAGQIAFPGGRVEDRDSDIIATALRETEEEIGLSRTRIEPVGRLDRYVTRTGFAITPVVGIVHPPFELTLDANEVDEAFEVPLDFILDRNNRRLEQAEFQGVTRHFYVFPYGDRYIWGATAGMLVNLAELLTG
jgi:8-oxo-dGTP pyrophosphatase MutT (NUDIX family)